MLESKNGIIGAAIGDAMGLPVQFNDREYFKAHPVTKMLGHMCFNMPEGSWSDDTSMTLATVDAIIKDKEINTKTIADNFVKWLKENEFTPTGKAYDVGGTCMKAVLKYARGVDKAEECGLTGEMDNGNGSLMRIIPVAYYCNAKNLPEEEIYEVVKKVSSITHGHEIAVMGCFMYVMFAINLLKGDTLDEVYQKIKVIEYGKHFSDYAISKYDRIINHNIGDYDVDSINSSGYVLDTLEAALWSLFNTESYDAAIIKAINLGLDTDTVGACTGGLAGIYYGLDSINEDWKKTLIKYDYIEEMCEKFDEALEL